MEEKKGRGIGGGVGGGKGKWRRGRRVKDETHFFFFFAILAVNLVDLQEGFRLSVKVELS